MPQPLKLDGEMEMKRKKIVRSFSIARNIYSGGLGSGLQPIKESEVEAGAKFLELGIVAGRGGRERTMDLGVKKSWAAAMEFERLSFS
ncbi:protein NtpR-like [Prunus yedoensis var. nudiflora]|uniref:Protein NtpR-like n=1 Tax=Prunus yedoensis var. nudiflora TaxID=2094558 RepID=A0A314UCY2_PRUYE|nr:protein NtpR-like [Prunus yedoensis var. nudiflora]